MVIWPAGTSEWDMLDRRFPDKTPEQLRFLLRTPVKPFPQSAASRLQEKQLLPSPQNTPECPETRPPLSSDIQKPIGEDVAQESGEGVDQQLPVQNSTRIDFLESLPTLSMEQSQSTPDSISAEGSRAPISILARKVSLSSTDPRLRGRLEHQLSSAPQSPIVTSPSPNIQSSPFDEDKSRMLEALGKDGGSATQHLKKYFNIIWEDMVPRMEDQSKREEEEVKVFLHYPKDDLKEERNVLNKFLASANAKRYDSLQPGEWKLFHQYIQAGVILVRHFGFLSLPMPNLHHELETNSSRFMSRLTTFEPCTILATL